MLLNNGHSNVDAQAAEDRTYKFGHAAPGAYGVYLGAQDLAVGSLTVRGVRMVHDKLEVQGTDSAPAVRRGCILHDG